MTTQTKAATGIGAALVAIALAVFFLLPGSGTPGAGPDTLEAYQAALARTVDASSYAFSSEVRTDLGNGTYVVRINGRVDGDNRTLTVTTDQGTSRMTVENGVATVDRGDGPQQIPVEQVADAPRLTVLKQLENVQATDDGTVKGTLPADQLVQSVGAAEVSGAGTVTVTFEPDGTVTGYVVRALQGRYRAEVHLSDVG